MNRRFTATIEQSGRDRTLPGAVNNIIIEATIARGALVTNPWMFMVVQYVLNGLERKWWVATSGMEYVGTSRALQLRWHTGKLLRAARTTLGGTPILLAIVVTIEKWGEVFVSRVLFRPLLRAEYLVIAFLLSKIKPTSRINFVLGNRFRIVEDEPLLVRRTVLLHRTHNSISSRVINEGIVELYL